MASTSAAAAGLGIAMSPRHLSSDRAAPRPAHQPQSRSLRRPHSQSDLRGGSLGRSSPLSPNRGNPMSNGAYHKYSQLAGDDGDEFERTDRGQVAGPSVVKPFIPSPSGLNPFTASPNRYPHEARPQVASQASDPGPMPTSRSTSRPVSMDFMRSLSSGQVRQSHFSPPTPPEQGSGLLKLAKKKGSTQVPAASNHQRYYSNGDISMYAPLAGANTPGADFSIRTAGSAVFPPRATGRRGRALSEGTAQLHRQGTLLTPMASAKRSSAELGIILGSTGNMKASKGKLLPQGDLPIEEKLAKLDQVKLEAKKGNKARVEVDVILERDVLVEGGDLRGRLEVRVRRAKPGEGKVWIGGGKLRIVGFEDVAKGGGRHIFYHYPYVLPVFAPYWTPEVQHCSLFGSEANEEGHRIAVEGTHSIPFSFRLPAGGGAKGAWAGDGKAATVRYVVVGSIKLHVPDKKKRAIAHFYRPATVYPYISPEIFHAPAQRPVEATTTKGLGWSFAGDKGQVTVRARLSRPTWVAGQKVWVEVQVANGCAKKIHTLEVVLLRDITQFHPVGDRKTVFSWRSESTQNEGFSHRLPQNEGYQPYSVRKKLCEERVEAVAGAGGGYVGAKGWWSGVEPGMQATFEHSLNIPHDCLTINRSRLLSVTYVIRVKLNGSISVDLPINIINFISIDPPPSFGLSLASGPNSTTQLQTRSFNGGQSEAFDRLTGKGASASRAMDLDDLRSQIELPGADTVAMHRVSFPQLPSSRSRPLSMQSALTTTSNPETSFPFNGQIMPSIRSRPHSHHSTLHKSKSASALRPRTDRRDTTMSYLSAVASEEEDLRLLEAHRRAGRQASLAAIQYAAETNRAADLAVPGVLIVEEEPTPPQDSGEGAFDAEATPRADVAIREQRDGDADMEEALRDLERIPEDEHDVDEYTEDHTFEEVSIDERDRESRQLEEDLASDHPYTSRFGADHSNNGKLARGTSPLIQPGQLAMEAESASASAESHSSYDNDSADPGNSPHPTASPFDLGMPMSSPIDVVAGEDQDDMDLESPAFLRNQRYGSFAESSYQESEVGVVYQAQRQDPHAKRTVMPHLQILLNDRDGRKGSLPMMPAGSNQGKQHLLEVPRANSLGAPFDPYRRRPSAPALFNQPIRKASAPPTIKVPVSPGAHSLNGGRGLSSASTPTRELKKKSSFTFATSNAPIRARESVSTGPPSPRTVGPPLRGNTASPQVVQGQVRATPTDRARTPVRTTTPVAHVKARTSSFAVSPRTMPLARSRDAELDPMHSPGLAPSNADSVSSRASTPDSFEVVARQVEAIGQEIAKVEVSSPVRVRHANNLSERARTPEQSAKAGAVWTPPPKVSRERQDTTRTRAPLSGPRLRVISDASARTLSPNPGSPSRLTGPRASPSAIVTSRMERQISRDPESSGEPLTPTRKSYTAKLGPRPLPPSPARTSSNYSHDKAAERYLVSAGVHVGTGHAELRRKASANSLASVSTTATSVENALMRHKALVADERAHAWDTVRIGEGIEEDDSEGLL